MTLTDHKPIGTIGLIGAACAALFVIVFISWGIKDIRAGEGAGPTFFLAWLVLIALVMVFGPRLLKRKPKPPPTKPGTMSGGFDTRKPLAMLPLLLQDTLPDGPTPMLDDHTALYVLIGLLAIAAIVVITIAVRRSNAAGDS